MNTQSNHVIVYRETGRYAGWPANYGIWHWGDEIVVGFTVGYFQADGGFHPRDKTRPFTTMQARSPDGGQSWQVNPMPIRTPGNRALSADEHVNPALQLAPLLSDFAFAGPPPDIDFTAPDFALLCGRSGLAAGARSWFYLSADRCRTWQGPYALPDFGLPGIAARTDYLIEGPQQLLLLLTAAKSNGQEGRVFCARSEDGGRNFSFVSWVGPEPGGYSIMPASLRLTSGRILTALRRYEPGPTEPSGFIELYASDDAGASWQWLSTPVSQTGRNSNPPAFLQLRDGRLALIYGYRAMPYGIRARLSADDGQSWSPEIVLRADGGHADLGYPRSVQRADGRVVTVYYFDHQPNGERYIAATIWNPEAIT